MSSSAPYGGGSAAWNKLSVKNRTPASVQITAEQLLREAVDRQGDDSKAPIQRIVDENELQEYRVRKRKEFEDQLRLQRQHIGNWIKYAQWEASQKEFRRARSVFERALHVEYTNVSLWEKYIEMEVKNKFLSSARNLYDRVVGLLPRVDKFWYKYAHLEELLGNYRGARIIFDRWMEWEPEDKSWMLYIKFEERCQELERARKIFERFLSVKPSVDAFLKFCKFEERHKHIVRARAGFEKAIEFIPQEYLDENFYLKFAEFEERQKEFERAKVIYQQALQTLPKGSSDTLYRQYISFQKQFGDRDELEDAILTKRRFFYEDEIKQNPFNYDVWFDYIRLEETHGDAETVRDLYERAVAHIPPIPEKRYWKRYIYLWIYYALFEELEMKNMDRCRDIYDKAIQIVPHKKFSFAKLWQYYAEFEVRQMELQKARKIFGRGIGECGKDKIFTAYAGLEVRLGNIDRCRTIYAKFIEAHPTNPAAWLALIELESMAEETERARAVSEIAIRMQHMDMPEQIWKAYIDMEINLGEIENARALYARLLEKTQHFKVYKSLSEFEFKEAENIENARKALKEGLQLLADNKQDEERALLLQHWLKLERENGDEKAIEAVWKKQPKKVKRKRTVLTEDGTAQGFEEHTAYLFPEDGQSTSNLKILEAAKKWKRTMKES